jgi:hypothetical protein
VSETRWDRWGGAASGSAVFVAGAAATASERGVPRGVSARELTDFYARNRDALLAQSLLFLIGAGIFQWYVASVRAYLARAVGRAGELSLIVFGAGVAWTAVSVAAQASQAGFALGSTSEVPPALVGKDGSLYWREPPHRHDAPRGRSVVISD